MKNKDFICIIRAILGAVLISGCIGQTTGTIRECGYTMGERNCGKCYCLETPEKGCEIIDISGVGDLAYAVNKTVRYVGTRDTNLFHPTRMCPTYIKLFRVETVPPA